MDKMNFLNVLTISIPEAILNIYLGLMIIGEKGKLHIGLAVNRMRLLLFVVLSVSVSFVIRYFIPIPIAAFVLIILIYIPIVKYVYNILWKRAITCVLFFMGVLWTIELAYMGQLMSFINVSLGTILSSNTLRIIISLPERVLQLAILLTIWRKNEVLFDIRRYKKLYQLCNTFLILIYVVEMIFIYNFVSKIEGSNTVSKVLSTLGCVIFVAINIIVAEFISLVTKSIRAEIKESYENEMIKEKNMIKVINDYLEKKEVGKAQKVCQLSLIEEGGNLIE